MSQVGGAGEGDGTTAALSPKEQRQKQLAELKQMVREMNREINKSEREEKRTKAQMQRVGY